jgi:hypothetical protein
MPRGEGRHDRDSGIRRGSVKERLMSISRRSFLKSMTAAGVAVAVPKAGGAKRDFAGYPDSGGVLHDTTLLGEADR